jgi:hypothetical protein
MAKQFAVLVLVFTPKTRSGWSRNATGERPVGPPLETLIAAIDSKQPPHGNGLRIIRGLAVLEHTNTPASRKLIADIASGMESARATREAKESLEKLQ